MLPKIIPTILTKSVQEFEKRIRTVEPMIAEVQVDVVDGVFAPNQTLSLETISQIETDLGLDIHLMVDEPRRWIDKCFQIMSRRVIGQTEKMASQEEFVAEVAQAGVEVGLAIDLGTKIKTLNRQALSGVDLVLLLAVRAGFGGQKFDPQVFKKIETLKKLKKEESFRFKIGVDGGLNQENILKVVQAGADELCIGSAIFNQKDPVRAIKKLRRLLEK